MSIALNELWTGVAALMTILLGVRIVDDCAARRDRTARRVTPVSSGRDGQER